ncbi:MAG: 5-formyltetrahydrofolate cyclo-ligase [Lentisphaeria bacterium]|nr:5-formyltetrahydrofolate cyclo-ligase [Lentisphaeria bacterium]
MESKQDIRRAMLARRGEVGSPDAPSEWVAARVRGLAAWPRASAVTGYMALDGEVDVGVLLRESLARGIPVWLPRYSRRIGAYEMVAVRGLGKDLARGHFGILEPAPDLPPVEEARRTADDVLWLVPGVAFDEMGHRIGRGKGYFDRLLRSVRGCRVGVAWDWQVLPRLPCAEEDVSMHWIVTQERAIPCAGAELSAG